MMSGDDDVLLDEWADGLDLRPLANRRRKTPS